MAPLTTKDSCVFAKYLRLQMVYMFCRLCRNFL